jgi:poly(hydroxyalkanoate) depolymerase family esterase
MLHRSISGGAMSIHTISTTINRALAAAGLNPQSVQLAKVSETIRKALAAAGIASRAAHRAPTPGSEQGGPAQTAFGFAPEAERAWDSSSPVGGVGQFIQHTFSNAKGSRQYKLYVPSAYVGVAMPLVVMLHGCKQNPDDFASGTRMNVLSERHGFLVAYPAQTSRANGANCWNWFESAEQSRDGVEASLIAGIAREIGHSYGVDTTRVFVAGLSAGGAMAVILGSSYPDVFAAVGVHSGLPLGAAHDVGSAFAAMRGVPLGALGGVPRARSGHLEAAHLHGVPTIVFHGDRDTTVAVSNGQAVVEQAKLAFESGFKEPLRAQVLPAITVGGREVETTRYTDALGHSRIESWLVHGASHAWSGGSPEGSYTDAKGPDASAQFVRFFLQQ